MNVLKPLSVAIILSSFGLTSCMKSDKKTKTVETPKEIALEIDDTEYIFPSSEEILSYINEGELKFDETLLNSTKNKEKYISFKSKTLNLGAYVADLAYISIFNKREKTIEYFSVVEELSEDINLENNLSAEVRNRILENTDNLDSLVLLYNGIYESMVDKLIRSDNKKEYVISSAGAFIESMYIVLQFTSNDASFNGYTQRILEQKMIFDDLLYMMNQLKDDEDIALIFNDLQTVNDAYNEIDITFYSEANSGDTEDDKIVITGNNEVVVNARKLDDFKSLITYLRNNWTKN